MNGLNSLIFFGWLAVALHLILPSGRKTKLVTVLLLSTAFLYYTVKFNLPNTLVLLSAFVFYLLYRLNVRFLMIAAVLIVPSVFIAIKSGYFQLPNQSTNHLVREAVPFGFSFIMFHGLALLLDGLNNRDREKVSFLDYCASVFYFPTLAIGPFYKVQQFLNFSSDTRKLGIRFFQGYSYFCFGFFKFGFAGILVRPLLLPALPYKSDFLLQNKLHPINIMLLSSLYLYMNFSGFSDLVVGFSKMMGFDVPFNFKFPFLAKSMAEYWRKWHMTLGAWFRDYLFLPLNLFIAPKIKFLSYETATKLSIFICFLLIGLWHDISYRILFYAAINALLVAFFSVSEDVKGLKKYLAIAITFICILLVNQVFMSNRLVTFLAILNEFQYVEKYAEAGFMNFKVALFVFVVLAIVYFSEKLFDLISDYEKTYSKKLIFAIAAASVIYLFLGLSIGLSGYNVAYEGF